jgi:hypothetical protein
MIIGKSMNDYSNTECEYQHLTFESNKSDWLFAT